MLLVITQGYKGVLEELAVVMEAMAELVNGTPLKLLFHRQVLPPEVVVVVEPVQLITDKVVFHTQ
jgi:hypothetical protein